MAIYAVGLAFATFIEKYHGTAAAKAMIYFSPVFILLQFIIVVNYIVILVKNQYIKRKKWALIMVHTSFVVILLGALVTHLFGKEGSIHIREGEKSNEMVMETSRGTITEKLPFELELTDFRLIRYPGSHSPSSYESDLLIHVDGEVREAKVFMNNIVDIKGYRFFQASYDNDEKGTILSVNQDVAGRNITYCGYFFLLMGFIMSFVLKNSRFRQLMVQLREVRKEAKIAILVLLLLSPISSFAQPMMDGESMSQAVQKNAVPTEHAAFFGSIPIQWNGRIAPINTFSSEILRKLHKEEKIGNLNSDQFLLGVLAMPQMWMHVPFIEISNKEIEHYYRFPGEQCAYNNVFDESGGYKLMPELEKVYAKPPSERNSFDKDLIKLDERINIFHQLVHNQLINIFPKPDDAGHRWYAAGDDLSTFPHEDSLFVTRIYDWYMSEVNESLRSGDWGKPNELVGMIKAYQLKRDSPEHIRPNKIKAELSYNKWNLFNRCKKGYLIAGGLLLVFAFVNLFERKKWADIAIKIFTGIIVLVFAFHAFGMGMRWYISGYAPWSNSYETMVYVGWATVLAGLIFGRKSALTMALATLFGGIILFVSGLNWMDPQIGTLVPVLKSPWLMFHVAIIVAAYGFFGIGLLLGLTNLSLMSFAPKKPLVALRIKELTIINNMSLLVGMALMCIGTFIGAVWANESWGRYWGWDPKETWALITIVVYAIVTHLHLIKKVDNVWVFNLSSVLAFASVLMTFLGVNYLLSGMHSYGQNDNVAQTTPYFFIAFFVVLALAVFSNIGFRKMKKK